MRNYTVVLMLTIVVGCNKNKDDSLSMSEMTHAEISTEDETTGYLEKGYDLAVDQREMEQADEETNTFLDQLGNMYLSYWNEEHGEYEVPDEVLEETAYSLAENGYVIRADAFYSNIRNEEKFELFLNNSSDGKRGHIVLYELGTRASVTRNKYIFDGSDMYVLASRTDINSKGERIQRYCSYTRLKTWRYTDAGWFCYELCVPEYPEVTEMVDGSVLIRVKPISEECRAASERYVEGIGYQGNNILCSNWDAGNLEILDYTGMYEYLYAMDTGERFSPGEDADGIPADEFEELIMKYIPVSSDVIRENAAYDEEKQIYYWAGLGCMNYSPTFFGTSDPEVIDITENEDGTITLTVNAVCRMVLNDEAIITHELTIKDSSDGSFMYMGNKIRGDGINKIPAYQYRIPED